MKTRQVTERIGEKVGPIDPEFDWRNEGWDLFGNTNPAILPLRWEHIVRIRDASERGAVSEVLLYGNWHDVLDVGMYDGWPHWRPYPSVCVQTPYGAEWHGFTSISSIRIG